MAGDLSVAYQNIALFYSGVNNVEAQKWLRNVQESTLAWTLCDRILTDGHDPLACCFAAQTLRQKILKSLGELPHETYLSLRESLISHLSHINVSGHDQIADATATQLCLSVADLYIQVPQWNNWIAELLNKFTALEGDRTRMLLTLLRVFPEEIQTVRVGENRRNEIRDELAASGSSVLNYLSQVLEAHHTDSDMLKKVLQCLSAYLLNPALSTDQLASSRLMASVFHIVASIEAPTALHDAATECIVSALYRAEDQGAHLALATNLQQAVYQLHGAFNTAVALEDIDKLQNFGRIFTELAESLVEKIVNLANNDPTSLGSMHTLELLLLLAGHHDYSLVEMTFNVWYRISEGLFMIDDDAHVAKFKPYVNKYMLALYRHSRYDSEEDGIPDQDGDFADFRLKMYDMLATCAQSHGTWDEMEAALFIIATIIGNLVPEEDSVVPDLVKAIVGLPINSHPALLRTSMQLLGGCNEWLQKHPQYHDQVLHWLLQLATIPKFAAIATDAMEKVITKAAPDLTRLVPSLIMLIPHLESSQTMGKQMELAISCTLKACTALIMNLSEVEVQIRLTELCKPIIQRFDQVLHAVPTIQMNKENERAADSWARLAGEPILWIDRIATIFKEIRPWCGGKSKGNVQNGNSSPAPWLDIATALYHVLSASLKKYEAVGRTVEHACRSIRFLVRSLGVQSIGLVEPLVTQMMDIYSRHQHSCFLYLSSILVDEYGAMEAVQPGLMVMLQTLATGTFSLLAKENGPRDNPDTVDDLFRLSTRFVTRAPSAFFAHPVASALFNCGIACLTLDHQDANRSVTRFFVETIEQLMSARKVSGPLRRDMSEIICMLGKVDRMYYYYVNRNNEFGWNQQQVNFHAVHWALQMHS
uniref:Importin N-terminal domain-containing protein n=1 Tax=Heterorhabditis bacteriophora TaxID=37862 RepID=A0A1I7XTW7_HETBA